MSTTCFCIIVEAKLRYTGILSTYSSMLEIEEVSFQHFFFFGAQLAEICNGSWRHKRKKGNPSFTITMKILIASSVYNAVCRNLVSMVLEWPIYRRILKITEHLNPDCTPIKSLKKKLSSSVILRFKFFLLVKFWQYRHVWWQLKKQGCIWSCYAVKWTTKAVTYFKTSSKHEIRHRYPIINNCYTYIHTRTYNTYRQYIQTHLSFHSVRQLLFLSCGGLCLVRRFWRRRRYVGNDGAMTSAPTSFRSVFWRYTHFHENLNRNSSLLHACM